MRRLFNTLSILFLLCFCELTQAQVITIGLEPFPPFVNQQGEGLTIDMLRKLERISSLTFQVEIMTYARAKHELQSDRLVIAGHTPKGKETAEFYQYAIELEWQIDTTADIFSFNAEYLDKDKIRKGKLGTTLGNAGFFAEILGVEKERFTEVSSLNQLVDMFIVGRLDAILFERASVMTLLQRKKVPDVYYQSIGVVPASIAVKKSPEGMQLKSHLDSLIGQVNTEEIFADYLKFTRLPDKGIVPTE